mmetsp:Transcript_88475/g.153550  ORF Transcript_88475/g.153550 Transcript_88475/m.153550 type:complete len:299 (-) Transcript_88475:197-1093(-)
MSICSSSIFSCSASFALTARSRDWARDRQSFIAVSNCCCLAARASLSARTSAALILARSTFTASRSCSFFLSCFSFWARLASSWEMRSSSDCSESCSCPSPEDTSWSSSCFSRRERSSSCRLACRRSFSASFWAISCASASICSLAVASSWSRLSSSLWCCSSFSAACAVRVLFCPSSSATCAASASAFLVVACNCWARRLTSPSRSSSRVCRSFTVSVMRASFSTSPSFISFSLSSLPCVASASCWSWLSCSASCSPWRWAWATSASSRAAFSSASIPFCCRAPSSSTMPARRLTNW